MARPEILHFQVPTQYWVVMAALDDLQELFQFCSCVILYIECLTFIDLLYSCDVITSN